MTTSGATSRRWRAMVNEARRERGETLLLSAGLLVLGASTYAFLLIAGQVLGDRSYAPLGALWSVVFLACPGVFFPIEQELSRAIAARRAGGDGTLAVAERAGAITLLGVVALLLVTWVAHGRVADSLFDGDALLSIGLALAVASYAGMYFCRGVLAGSGRLGAYGVIIGGEGCIRVLAAAVLAAVGVDEPGAFGIVVGAAPLCAFVMLAWVARTGLLTRGGHRSGWRDVTASIGSLVVASVFSQTLVNVAPILVKASAPAASQAAAGAFTKAVIVTRIPLFLFQAVQAAMLPKLAQAATVGDLAGFRRVLRTVTLIVALVALLGVGAAALFGDAVLALFGTEKSLGAGHLALLAAGNGAFLLGLTVSQALIALHGQGRTAVGWFLGVGVFMGVFALDGDVFLRAEWALLAGALAAAATMSVLVLRLERGLVAPAPARP